MRCKCQLNILLGLFAILLTWGLNLSSAGELSTTADALGDAQDTERRHRKYFMYKCLRIKKKRRPAVGHLQRRPTVADGPHDGTCYLTLFIWAGKDFVSSHKRLFIFVKSRPSHLEADSTNPPSQ